MDKYALGSASFCFLKRIARAAISIKKIKQQEVIHPPFYSMAL